MNKCLKKNETNMKKDNLSIETNPASVNVQGGFQQNVCTAVTRKTALERPLWPAEYI